MKTILITTILAAAFAASRALAGDVAYELETKPLYSIEEPTLGQPLTMAFEERSWVVPAIEEAAGLTTIQTGIPVSIFVPVAMVLSSKRLLRSGPISNFGPARRRCVDAVNFIETKRCSSKNRYFILLWVVD